MDTEATALKRYNSLFDNVQYSAIAEHIATDLQKDRESLRVSDLMNTIIDTCLECCGSPNHDGSHVLLARLSISSNLSDETTDTIHHYLLTFQQPSINTADDFMMIKKALAGVHIGQQIIGEAATYANGVHSWQGRTAYHLLVAAEYLTKSAEILLDQSDNGSYLHENLQHGLNQVSSALYEGTGHSDEPKVFNFKEIDFPKEADC